MNSSIRFEHFGAAICGVIFPFCFRPGPLVDGNGLRLVDSGHSAHKILTFTSDVV